VVDKGLSYLTLCDLLADGGSSAGKRDVNVISFEPGKTSVNIFELPKGVLTPPDEKKLSVVEFLEALLPQEDGGKSMTRYSLLQAAVEQTYAYYTEEVPTPGSEGGYTRQLRPFRLSHYVERLHKLERVGNQELDSGAKGYARNVAMQLGAFTGNSPYGKLLDQDTSSGAALGGDFTYIEYSAIEKHKELTDIILLLINELIWQRVYRNPGRRSKAFFDETWSLLSHEKAKAVVVRGYREGRKYGMGSWAISQAISDMANVPGILSSTSTFLLGQGLNEGEQLHKLAEFPLEASAMLPTLGAGLKGGREFLLGMRLADDALEGAFVGDVIRYTPDPYSYWVYTTNDADKRLRNKYTEEHGTLAGLERLVASFKPTRG